MYLAVKKLDASLRLYTYQNLKYRNIGKVWPAFLQRSYIQDVKWTHRPEDPISASHFDWLIKFVAKRNFTKIGFTIRYFTRNSVVS